MGKPSIQLGASLAQGAALAAVLAAALVAPAAAVTNVLANPGFEADASFGGAPVPGATGWAPFVNAWTTTAPAEPTHSGNGALRLTGIGGISVPGVFQTFAASPGQTWDFSGYMLSRDALPSDATFSLLKIVWSDGTNFLAPGIVNIGTVNFVDPGIESVPLLDSNSTPGSWQFSQAQGVAPAGTQIVHFFALFVDQSPGAIYVDDLAAGIVPEPHGAALLLLGLAGLALRRSRV